MTKEEAKEIIESECYVFNPLNFDRTTRINTALDVAVEALEQEQCNDAISRRAVLNTLDSTDKFLDETRTVESYKTLLEECYKNLPSVTPTKCIATVKFSKEDMQELVNEKMKDIVVERKKGKWEYSGSYDVEGMLYCSCCKHEIDVSEGYFKYCPNCGCKMSEGEKE